MTIMNLHARGFSFEEIALQMQISSTEVKRTVANNLRTVPPSKDRSEREEAGLAPLPAFHPIAKAILPKLESIP
jgi:hypothetical protein